MLDHNKLAVETVELDGKKVIAFYYYPGSTEFPETPGPLRLIGDFMLALPDEQLASTFEEADYYLVLTPEYKLGDSYETNHSKNMKVQEVYSLTSIDLYDAESGRLIRHLKTLKESYVDRMYDIVKEDSSPMRYPKMVDADILLFMYQNINEPDLFKHIWSGNEVKQALLGVGDSAQIEDWELVLDSYETFKSFEERYFLYTAKDEMQFLSCRFTVTNHKDEEMTLLPMIYYIGKDLVAVVTDWEGTVYRPSSVFASDKYSENRKFGPGETSTCYLLFEVPDSLIEGESPIQIDLSIEPQRVVYTLY